MTENSKKRLDKRNRSEDISHLLYGKVPPQARDMERVVLGACLIERHAFVVVADMLSPQCFYVDAHARIYTAMQQLFGRGEPIDLLTTCEQLRRSGELENVGGAFYLSELTNEVASSAHISTHARIIYQKFVQREMIRIGNDIIREAYEDTTDGGLLLDNALTEFTKLSSGASGSTMIGAADAFYQVKQSLLKGEAIGTEIQLGLGVTMLTKTFNVIAAKPNTGKTAMMLEMAENAGQEHPVGILSMEMSREKLTARLIQRGTGIGAKRIVSAKIDDYEKQRIFELPEFNNQIVIDDDAMVTRLNIRAKLAVLKLKYRARVVFIDYLQLIQLCKEYGMTDVRAVELLCNDLQRAAKDYDMLIIALSQLTRDKENKRPTQEDLRGGGIEQACSDIWIIYDRFLNENENRSWREIPIERRGQIEFYTAKTRDGDRSHLDIYFDKPTQTMRRWDARPLEFEPIENDQREPFNIF